MFRRKIRRCIEVPQHAALRYHAARQRWSLVRCKEGDDAEDGWDAQGIETRDSERGLRKVSHHEDRYRKAVELEKDLRVLLRW